MTRARINGSGRIGMPLSQAAAELGVHPATLRRWADDGVIGSVRTPGNQRRFTQAHLADFMARLSGERGSAPREIADRAIGEFIIALKRLYPHLHNLEAHVLAEARSQVVEKTINHTNPTLKEDITS